MFPLRPIPTPDYCDRVGCIREPEVVLDRQARLAREFPRARVALCMACLAEAEHEVSARERADKLERHGRDAALAAARLRGAYW